MASTEELVEAISRLIASSPTPIPVTLMNDGVDETAAIIGALVERCARDNIALTEIFLDPDLAELLGLVDGGQLPHGSKADGSMRRCTGASSAFFNRMITIPLRLAAAKNSTGGGDKVEPDRLAAAEAVSRSGGGPSGVYRPEDRLTPPALRRAACDNQISADR